MNTFQRTSKHDKKQTNKSRFRSIISLSSLQSIQSVIVIKSSLSSIIQKFNVLFEIFRYRSIEIVYCRVLVVNDADQVAMQYFTEVLHDFIQKRTSYEYRAIVVSSSNIQSDDFFEYIQVINHWNAFWIFFIKTSYFSKTKEITTKNRTTIFSSSIHSFESLFLTTTHEVLCVNIVSFSSLVAVSKVSFFVFDSNLYLQYSQWRWLVWHWEKNIRSNIIIIVQTFETFQDDFDVIRINDKHMRTFLFNCSSNISILRQFRRISFEINEWLFDSWRFSTNVSKSTQSLKL